MGTQGSFKYLNVNGQLISKRPIGNHILCYIAGCDQPAYWTCGEDCKVVYIYEDANDDISRFNFQGCGKTVCDNHCMKYTKENARGYTGQNYPKGRLNKELYHSCTDTYCIAKV